MQWLPPNHSPNRSIAAKKQARNVAIVVVEPSSAEQRKIDCFASFSHNAHLQALEKPRNGLSCASREREKEWRETFHQLFLGWQRFLVAASPKP
jgi:hypothetical protein